VWEEIWFQIVGKDRKGALPEMNNNRPDESLGGAWKTFSWGPLGIYGAVWGAN